MRYLVPLIAMLPCSVYFPDSCSQRLTSPMLLYLPSLRVWIFPFRSGALGTNLLRLLIVYIFLQFFFFGEKRKKIAFSCFVLVILYLAFVAWVACVVLWAWD